MAAILSNQMILDGGIEGYFELIPPASGKKTFTFTGWAKAHDLQWLWGNFLRQLSVTSLSVQGKGEELRIHDLEVLFENETVNCQGLLTFTEEKISTDLTFKAKTLSQTTLTHFIDDLRVFLHKLTHADITENKIGGEIAKKIGGEIRVETDEFLFAETIKEGKKESYKLAPLQGRVDFSDPDSTTLFLTDSFFCDLAIEGTLKWKEETSRKHFTLKNQDGQLPLFEDFFSCTGVEKNLISGPFSVNATLTDVDGTLSSGEFHLRAEKGTLKKMNLLSKVFKLINFSDLYQGLFTRGFRYKALEIHGHVEENLLILDKAVMEGEGMDIMAQGNINLLNMQTNLTLFIVPFKTIDKILNFVPLVGRIVGGKKRHIITYPVKVTGDLKEPDISLLSASAIGKAAVDFVFDTLTFPLDLLPGSDEEEFGENEKETGEDTVITEGN